MTNTDRYSMEYKFVMDAVENFRASVLRAVFSGDDDAMRRIDVKLTDLQLAIRSELREKLEMPPG